MLFESDAAFDNDKLRAYSAYELDKLDLPKLIIIGLHVGASGKGVSKKNLISKILSNQIELGVDGAVHEEFQPNRVADKKIEPAVAPKAEAVEPSDTPKDNVGYMDDEGVKAMYTPAGDESVDGTSAVSKIKSFFMKDSQDSQDKPSEPVDSLKSLK